MYKEQNERLKAKLGISARAINALRTVGVDVENEAEIKEWVFENSIHLKRVPNVGHGTSKELLERFGLKVPTRNSDRVERSKKIVERWLEKEINGDEAMQHIAFLMDFRIIE